MHSTALRACARQACAAGGRGGLSHLRLGGRGERRYAEKPNMELLGTVPLINCTGPPPPPPHTHTLPSILELHRFPPTSARRLAHTLALHSLTYACTFARSLARTLSRSALAVLSLCPDPPHGSPCTARLLSSALVGFVRWRNSSCTSGTANWPQYNACDRQ